MSVSPLPCSTPPLLHSSRRVPARAQPCLFNYQTITPSKHLPDEYGDGAGVRWLHRHEALLCAPRFRASRLNSLVSINRKSPRKHATRHFQSYPGISLLPAVLFVGRCRKRPFRCISMGADAHDRERGVRGRVNQAAWKLYWLRYLSPKPRAHPRAGAHFVDPLLLVSQAHRERVGRLLRRRHVARIAQRQDRRYPQ
jgi:hypothetical protein